MSNLSQSAETFYKNAPISTTVAVLSTLALAVSFFLPAVISSVLASIHEGVYTWGGIFQIILASLVVLSCALCGRAFRGTYSDSNVWLGVMLGVLICVLSFLFFGVTFGKYSYVLESQSSKIKINLVEQRLGRSTPLGDELRAAMTSLDALVENRQTIRTALSSNDNSDDVIKVISLAPLVGQDHPVIKFAIDNGMAQKDSSVVLYRDLIERMKQDPSLAENVDFQQALSMFAAR